MIRSIAGTVSKAISRLIGARLVILAILAWATLLAACGTRLKPHIVQQDSRAVEVVTAGTGAVNVVF